MRMYDIIKKKRDGCVLSKQEIDFFINGYTSGEIPDYQVSALLMAIFIKGMNIDETVCLTKAIAASGDNVDLSGIEGIKVDKHSTGGVGDKVSIVIGPIVAACGVKMAKMSGRGLGHTGGTIDKLKSITGYRTSISQQEFFDIVNKVGFSIIGQSGNLAPADKMLYALRDVTATVDNISLIASSIMGKKLVSGDDCILLDVKVGSGAFMKTLSDAEKLARLMVNIGKAAGKKTVALLTDMDRPLGYAVGNSIEVYEAVQTLLGNGKNEFPELCIQIAGNLLYMAEKGDLTECYDMARKVIANGSAFEKLVAEVKMHGGDVDLLYNPDRLLSAKYKRNIVCDFDGYITAVDTEKIGLASLALGAGRNKKDDKIDLFAGLIINKRRGDFVRKGDVMATLYCNNVVLFDASEKAFNEALSYGNQKPADVPVVLERIE